MKSCFLDTCAVIDILAGRQEPVEALAEYDDVLVSHVVLGELIFGCHRSRHPERELARIAAWLPTVSVITPTPETAGIYGAMAADLEKRGIRSRRMISGLLRSVALRNRDKIEGGLPCSFDWNNLAGMEDRIVI